ncbi:tetratricopeptide repeat protein [Phormidesmis priestleyi]
MAYYQQALPIFQQVKDRDGEATTLNNLGTAYLSLSQYVLNRATGERHLRPLFPT